MKIKITAELRKTLRLLIFFSGIIVISQCNTSNKVASSFDKRKYTPGHFSDLTAKVNDISTPSGTAGSIQSMDESVINQDGNKPPSADITNLDKKDMTRTSPVIPQFIIAIQKRLGMNFLINGAEVNSKSANSTLKASASSQLLTPHDPHDDYSRGGNHINGNANSYLTAWLVCLGVALICWLLLLSWINQSINGTTNTNYGSGCAFLLIGALASIAAVVLFILWIVALASN